MTRNPLLDLLAALLPAAEREALYRRYGTEPAWWSFLFGLGELFAGARLLLADFFYSMGQLSDAVATHVMENLDPRQLDSFDAKFAVFGSGPLMWLTWAVRPGTWLLASIPLVGVVRLVAFAVSRETVGEPLVWLLLRAAQGVKHLRRAAADRLRFGPVRPDRLVQEPGWDLVVLSARPKPDWNERVTIEIGESFYRLHRVEERPDRRWRAHAHLLREAPIQEIFRGLVRYEPPAP